jgi:hypothetical protein
MTDAGVPLHVLQDILGHASMETTRRYLHPDDRHLASAAEHANAFLSRSGQRRHARQSTPPTRRMRCLFRNVAERSEAFWSLLVPLSTGSHTKSGPLSTSRRPSGYQGDHGGTNKNSSQDTKKP